MTKDTKWERIDDITDRLKVPGGWIVRSRDVQIFDGCSITIHQIFVADQQHEWVLINDR